MTTTRKLTPKQEWVLWLQDYGAADFYDAFVERAQGAVGRCVYCRQPITLDIVEGGGVPDWKEATGDYGCSEHPETNEDGTMGHEPMKGGS